MGTSEFTDTHTAWLFDILEKINHPNVLDSADVARDDLCALGQWIDGLADEYGDLPEYIDLKARHSELHRCASEAVRLAQQGNIAESKKCLSVEGRCIENSRRVLASCKKLMNKIDVN